MSNDIMQTRTMARRDSNFVTLQSSGWKTDELTLLARFGRVIHLSETFVTGLIRLANLIPSYPDAGEVLDAARAERIAAMPQSQRSERSWVWKPCDVDSAILKHSKASQIP